MRHLSKVLLQSVTAPSSLLSLQTATEQRPAAVGSRRVSTGWYRAAGLPEDPLFPGGGWGLPGSVSPEDCKSGAIEKACGQWGVAPRSQRRRQLRGDAVVEAWGRRGGVRAGGELRREAGCWVMRPQWWRGSAHMPALSCGRCAVRFPAGWTAADAPRSWASARPAGSRTDVQLTRPWG